MDFEESEIKIEYNDVYECDPLQEDYQENQSLVETEDLCEDSNGANDDDNQNFELHEHNSHTDLNIQENYTTWFLSKDINGKLLCKYCELKYSTVQTLRHHVKTKHAEEAKKLCKIIINNKRNRKHVCHVCKKRFKDLSDLTLHMSEHSITLVETSCMHCHATFSNVNELTEHIYMKHQRRNKITYMCKICGYRTSKKSHFRQHGHTHQENKALICKFCDYKTNYLPNLKIHERVHTNDKPYSCDFNDCDYRSSAKSALRSHQLKHFPKENMLFCDRCSYGTVYKQSLKKHLDSHKRNFVRKKSNGEVGIKLKDF